MARIVSVIVALMMLVPLFLFAASGRPEAGSTAPEFTLKSQDGTPVSLKDLRGKWVVLYFYPKDFTGGCTIEAHNFERDRLAYEKKNAVILGVSLDDVKSHKEFCVKEGLNFKLLADTEHVVSKAYGTLTNLAVVKFASRNTFLIDPNGKVAKVFTDVSPSKHSQEVLAELTSRQK
ncbi:MAG TPA: peroxiredoxin [Clostridia bacterium]|nr:peroxiredoxin [Clostridia bacterium]